MSFPCTSESEPLSCSRMVPPACGRNPSFLQKYPAILTAGFISGILTVITSTAFAALIFSGPLSGYVSQGVSFILLGAVIIGIGTALTSSYAGTVVHPSEIPPAILALVASIIATAMTSSGTGDAAFINVVAIIIITSLSTGALFLALGFLKAGNLIRFIPYPVIGGFLAGTGLLLMRGAFSFMTGKPFTLMDLFSLLQSDILVKWLPGLLLAVILFSILRWRNHYIVMPAWLLISMGLFYSILLVTDTSLAVARDHGWLMGSFQKVGLAQPLSLSSWAQIDWTIILGQFNRIGTIMIISCIALLLNASGIELVVREEIDLNRELRSTGLVNVLAGLVGGIVGIHSLSLSTLGHRMGVKSRIIGLLSAAVCGLALLFGSTMLSYFPMPVMGGVLVYISLTFLYEWLYASWFKLPRIDCLLILFILVVIGVFGFLEGVAAGLIVAVVIFVVRYSRVSVIKQSFSGTNYYSSVDRPPDDRHLLAEQGESIYILKLQGFIFFGTANNLLEEIRKRARDKTRQSICYILLDFRFVNGVDSSAANSFTKMKQYAETEGFKLIFSHLIPIVTGQFIRGGFDVKEDGHFRTFVDLDRAMEWCENRILIEGQITHDGQRLSLEDQLSDFMPPGTEAGSVMKYLERQEVPEGYYLMRQGDPPQSLYFLESGQVTAQLEGKGKGKAVRLRTMGPGTVVGELGLYLRLLSTASVITDRPSVFYRLSEEALQKLEEDEPLVALAFHRFIVNCLGGRLVHANEALRALMD